MDPIVRVPAVAVQLHDRLREGVVRVRRPQQRHAPRAHRFGDDDRRRPRGFKEPHVPRIGKEADLAEPGVLKGVDGSDRRPRVAPHDLRADCIGQLLQRDAHARGG
jgi:hypothetical protein